jgi:mono/diheme cytochrome c family protein
MLLDHRSGSPEGEDMLPIIHRPYPISQRRYATPPWAWLCTLLCATAFAQTPAPKSISELKAFYQQHCTRCHGADGSATAPDGKRLGGLDFTKTAKDFRTTKEGPATEREIRTMTRVIQKGLLFGFSMPAWKDKLSQEETMVMVKEVLLKAEPGKVIQAEPQLAPSN